MEYICSKCNTKLEKTPNLLATGCTKCGSKVFKIKTATAKEILRTLRTKPQVRSRQDNESNEKKYDIVPRVMVDDIDLKRRMDLQEDNIPAIKLKEKGVYEVNVNGLFRNKKADPIILSGKTGIYRVEFLPVRKKD